MSAKPPGQPGRPGSDPGPEPEGELGLGPIDPVSYVVADVEAPEAIEGSVIELLQMS